MFGTFLPPALGRRSPDPPLTLVGPPYDPLARGGKTSQKVHFFENGLKTYIIGRSSPRASIWYRFRRKCFFLWRFMAIQRFWRFWEGGGVRKTPKGGGGTSVPKRGETSQKNTTGGGRVKKTPYRLVYRRSPPLWYISKGGGIPYVLDKCFQLNIARTLDIMCVLEYERSNMYLDIQLLSRAVVIGTQVEEYYARPLSELWAIYGQEKKQSRQNYELIMSRCLPGTFNLGVSSGPPTPRLGRPLKNAFFNRGLKTYIIRRSSPRASLWYRFHRKLLFLRQFMAEKRFDFMWPYFHPLKKRFSNLIYARPDGFHQNIMRGPMGSYFLYARLQSRELLSLTIARNNKKTRKQDILYLRISKHINSTLIISTNNSKKLTILLKTNRFSKKNINYTLILSTENSKNQKHMRDWRRTYGVQKGKGPTLRLATRAMPLKQRCSISCSVPYVSEK